MGMFFGFESVKHKDWMYDIISVILGLTLSLMVFAQLIYAPIITSAGLAVAVFLITMLLYFYNKMFLKWLAFFWLVLIEYLIANNTELYYMIFFILADLILVYYLMVKKKVLRLPF